METTDNKKQLKAAEFLIPLIDSVIQKNEDTMQKGLTALNMDYETFFVNWSESHFKSAFTKNHFVALRGWVQEAGTDEEILELVISGHSFMQTKLLGFRITHTSHNMHNLAEQLRLEVYSSLLGLYQLWINRLKEMI